MKKHLLIITDCTDVSANELYATVATALEQLGAEDVIIDPIVEVAEFSIINGNFISRLIADSYDPKYLTILAVVNPLDSSVSSRARIVGRLKNGIQIVGANTGIFSWLIEDFGIDEVYEANPTGLKGDSFISFGGKYIHAPIAAKLAATGDLLAVKYGDYDSNNLLKVNMQQGTVLHIDNFGNLKIYNKSSELNAEVGDKLNLFVGERRLGEAVYTRSMKELEVGTLAMYKGSSMDLLEIAIVRKMHTDEKLSVKIGDVISITSASI